MTRSGREIHAWFIGAAMMTIISGCASTPPPRGQMDAAVTAVSAARDAKADDFAPVELDRAEEALAAARDAIERRDHAVAQNLAEQAELDASLAAARSRAAAGRAAVARAVEENARLRRELLGDGGSR